MPQNQPTTIDSFLSMLHSSIDTFFQRATELDRLLPTSLLELEHHLDALLRSFRDQLIALTLNTWLTSTFLCSLTTHLYCQAHPHAYLKDYREVEPTFLGGHSHTFRIPSIAFKRTGPGRRKRKRGAGQGLRGFPLLQALGFVGKYSAAAALERGMAGVACPSFEAAREQLAARGLDSGQRSILKAQEDWSELLLGQLDGWLEQPESGLPPWAQDFELSRQTLVLSLDGGRIRERQDKPGRKKSHGDRDFEAPWVEPRLFALYGLDSNPQAKSKKRKLVDGCLADCEQTMARLRSD
jgi:hypothetical protein